MPIQYLYPNGDITTDDWSIEPFSFPMDKYLRIDEGTGTGGTDYLYKDAITGNHIIISGVFLCNTTSSFTIPSSVIFNLEGMTQQNVTAGSGFLTEINLVDRNNESRVSYWRGKSAAYSETRNTQSFNLSTFTGQQPYGNYKFDFVFSGIRENGFFPQYRIHAAEIVVSGTNISSSSGIPLYISGPNPDSSGIPLFLEAKPYTECLVPVDASSLYSTSAWNWQIHHVPTTHDRGTPEDSNSYTSPGNWDNYINSGIHIPDDDTAIHMPLGSGGSSTTGRSPHIYFNKTGITSDRFIGSNLCFRLATNEIFPSSGVEINDFLYISNIELQDENTGNIIANYPDLSIVPSSNGFIYDGLWQNFCVQNSSIYLNNWNNRAQLVFNETVQSPRNISNIYYSEMEICFSGYQPYSSGAIPLYIAGPIPNSSSIPLFIEGTLVSNSSIPLYIYGHDVINSGIPLFVWGNESSNSGIPLYITGHQIDASGIPLFISGPIPDSSGIPLYIAGHLSSSSGIPLYIQGPILDSGGMPLFIKVQEPWNIGSGLPLNIWASTPGTSGFQSTIPLYIGGSGDVQGVMPLFIHGPPYGESNAGMPLFLKMGNLNGTISADAGIPLYLQNSNILVSGSIPLYVAVQSGTLGAIPINADMPLFIARDSEGYASQMPLYVKVADSIGSGLAMYIDGVYTTGSGIPLVIPSTYDNKTNVLKLYTHGF